LDDDNPEFVEDGDRYDKPIPRRKFTKAVRSVAAVVVASMLFAAGTPVSWVSIVTAIVMLLIWLDIGRTNHDDTI
ncbi:MAG: hypothetical protein M3132_07730, partial [Actinomycetia bacterium]|nr:hypothetical protein [Actinomycetes bacterium]